MRARRALATLAAALALAACSPATPQQPAAPNPSDETAGAPGRILDQARDVAGQLEQRQAELESMLP